MQALSQSAFLQALGYAIANSLWQMAFLWLLVVLLNGVFRFTSRTKYGVALAAQVAGFTWFIFTLNFYYQTCSEALASFNSGSLHTNMQVINDPGMHSFSAAILSIIVKAEQLLPFLSVAYLALLVFLSVKWIKCYSFTQQIKKSGLHKPDVHWKLFVKRIASQLSIKADVKIYLSDLINSPLTIGFIKPIILVPIASINHLTTEQLEAVILHELAHIKRADYLVNILQSVIEITLFFNPFTQLLSKMIKKERENSCDDWVLQFQYNASMYAEALLRIAYLQSSSTLAMQATGVKGDLLSRVKRMLNQKEKTFNYRNQLFALVLITGIVSSVALLHPQTSVLSPQRTSYNTQQVVVEPLTATVSNPFFNPVYFLSKPLNDEVNKAMADAQTQMKTSSQSINKTTGIIANITPGVLEKINDLQDNIRDEIVQAGDEAGNTLQNPNLSLWIREGVKLVDTAAIATYVRNAFPDEALKVDPEKINVELAKAKVEIDKISKDNKWLAQFAGNWTSVLQKSLAGQQKIKIDGQDIQPPVPAVKKQPGNKNEDDAPGLLQKQNEKVQGLIEFKRKEIDSAYRLLSFEMKNKTNESADENAVYNLNYNFSDQDEDKDQDDNNFISANVPVKFNPSDYSYSVSSKKNKPVVVVLKGNAKNAESCTKKITIETVDSNGEKHVYNITVETYQ